MTAGILLSGQPQGDRIELNAAGSWTAEYAGAIEPQVEAAIRGVTARSIFINLARIDYLDTYGAWLLERTLRNWTNQGRDARLIGLREDYRGLFEKVHAGTQKLAPAARGPNSIMTTGERRTRLAIFLPRLRERCRLTNTDTTLPSVPSTIFFLA